MKAIILILTIISLVISSIWMFTSKFDYEPILAVISVAGALVAYYIYDNKNKEKDPLIESAMSNGVNQTTSNVISPVFNISSQSLVNSDTLKVENMPVTSKQESLSKSSIIELMKPKTNILFVDDDTKFQLVKILKDSGWRNTSTIKDIKHLDIPLVRNAEILFIDIHGVGKILKCNSEGLDLAQMIKEKYPEKKVVIYSAESQGSIFHKAWELADYKLEKNALPYQFESIIENISVGNYSKN